MIRYGVILGYALEDIEKGDWINEFMLELPTPPSVDDMEYGKKIVTQPIYILHHIAKMDVI